MLAPALPSTPGHHLLPISHANPVALYLEDEFITAARVERAVLKALPACRLVWARTIEEARVRSEGLPIELFIIDVELPDGNGLDFLSEMAAAHPTARAIVATATPLPEYEALSAALGAVRFLEKPLHLEELVAMVRDALGAEQTVSAAGAFSGTLRDLTPVDVVQLKCLTQATTRVEFRSGSAVGTIHFRRGEVVHAETGSLSGVEAFNEIIGWKRGAVSERGAEPPAEATIDCSWQALLMNAAQTLDESGFSAA